MANYPDAKLNVTGDWRQADGQQSEGMTDRLPAGAVTVRIHRRKHFEAGAFVIRLRQREEHFARFRGARID